MYLLLEGVTGFTMSMIFAVYMIVQVSVLKLSPFQLIIIGTALEIAILLFEVPTGIIADIYSRRLSLIIGVFMVGISFLLFAMFPSVEMALLNSVLWGIGYTFTSGARQAWITDEIGQERVGNAFIRGGQVASIGDILGLILGAILGSVNLYLPIYVSSILIIVFVAFMIWRMPENGFKPTPKEERSTFGQMVHTFQTGLGLMRLRPVLYTVVAIVLIYGLYSEAYDRLNTNHLLTNFQFPDLVGLQPVAWLTLVGLIGTFISLVASEGLRRRVDMNNSSQVVRALLFISFPMVAALIGFAFAGALWQVIICYWVFNTLRGLTFPLIEAWQNSYFESEVRATMHSMMGQVDAIGQLAGGPIMGGYADLLTGRFGLNMALRLTLFTAAILLSPVILLYLRARRGYNRSKIVLTTTEGSLVD
jgi:DHA3 family tetracycline resistance protein-like MFS transporter